jgi:hypothetical protein
MIDSLYNKYEFLNYNPSLVHHFLLLNRRWKLKYITLICKLAADGYDKSHDCLVSCLEAARQMKDDTAFRLILINHVSFIQICSIACNGISSLRRIEFVLSCLYNVIVTKSDTT